MKMLSGVFTLTATADGQSSFKSTVFCRQTDEPRIPEGGNFSSPYPNPRKNWHDGIPEGSLTLWASTRIFSSDGKFPQQNVWTKPRQMTDTATFRVMYSSLPSDPGNPRDNPSYWTPVAEVDAIWMATMTITNGIEGPWSVSKVKGENGNTGRNLLLDSTVRTLPATSGEWNYTTYELSEKLKSGCRYVISIGSSELLAGYSSMYSVLIYDFTNSVSVKSWNISFLSERKSLDFVWGDYPSSNRIAVLLYAGIAGSTSGVSARFNKVKLEEGYEATDWAPAPEDTYSYFEVTQAGIKSVSNKVEVVDENVIRYHNEYLRDAEGVSDQFTTIDSALRVHTSAIRLNAEQIATKVSSDYVQSEIKQTSDKIMLTVEELDSQVTGNLLINSMLNNSERWTTYLSPKFVTKNGIQCLMTNVKNSGMYQEWVDGVVNGETYTASVDVMSDTGGNYQIYLGLEQSNGFIVNISLEAGVWKRVYHTQVKNDAEKRTFIVYGGVGTFYFKNAQLEKGSTGTEWTKDPKNKMLATGIDIQSKKITVTADTFKVQNNSGNAIAVFNSDGQIEADRLSVNQLSHVGANGAIIKVSDGQYLIEGPGKAQAILGLNAKGYPSLQFYNAYGQLTFEIDGNGIPTDKSRPASWRLSGHYKYLGAPNDDNVFLNHNNAITNAPYTSGSDWSIYVCALNTSGTPTTTAEGMNDGLRFLGNTSTASTNNEKQHGWYVATDPQYGSVMNLECMKDQTGKYVMNDKHEKNHVNVNRPVYVKRVYCYDNGRFVRTQNFYYNLIL